MASLTAHLRRPDDHGRLSFHPECPICRQERLAGTLPDGARVSPRGQALLAAGVLALSSVAPTAVFAGEPEQEQEGTTAPEQITGNDPSEAPEFDAGGEPTQLPLDAGPAPEESGALDPTDEQTPAAQEPVMNENVPAPPAQEPAVNENVPAPLAQEPATNVPAANGTDEAGTPSAGEQQKAPAADPLAPAAEQPTPPAPPTAETPAPTPAPVAPAAQPQSTTPAAAEKDASAKAREREREAASEERQRARHNAPAPPNPATAPAPANTPATAPAPAYTPATAAAPTYTPPPAPQPEPVYVSSTTTTPQPAARQAAQTPAAGAHHRQAAHAANRFHTVQRGESLWSIARDLVGDGASAARIAREVNRLWDLNSARIGSGEPDLLMAGTRIALR